MAAISCTLSRQGRFDLTVYVKNGDGTCAKWALNPTQVVNSDGDCCGDVPNGLSTITIPNYTLTCKLPDLSTVSSKPCGCERPCAAVSHLCAD
jgi:hypothetical protein